MSDATTFNWLDHLYESTVYPLKPDRPLVICSRPHDFPCLLDALHCLANVVVPINLIRTINQLAHLNVSVRPVPRLQLLHAFPWYVAINQGFDGNSILAHLPERTITVLPPTQLTWMQEAQNGIGLRSFWENLLANSRSCSVTVAAAAATNDRAVVPGWRAADHEELRAILHRVRIGLHTPLESARLAAVLQASLIAHVERLVPLIEWLTERIRPEDSTAEPKP